MTTELKSEGKRQSKSLPSEAQATNEIDKERQQFIVTPDMSTYIEYKAAAGVTTLLKTTEEQHQFVKEYNSWVHAGRKRPMLPELIIEEDPIPMKLYRTKHLGRQKIYWREMRNKGALHGKLFVTKPVTRRVKNAVTGEEIEVTERQAETVEYPFDYAKAEGERLVEDAISRCPNPTFYFVNQGVTYSVNPQDFNGDFEEIIKLHKAKKYVLD